MKFKLTPEDLCGNENSFNDGPIERGLRRHNISDAVVGGWSVSINGIRHVLVMDTFAKMRSGESPAEVEIVGLEV